MLNVHLNGDIVRCPDSAKIRERANEVRDRHRICKYNYHEDNCKVWNNSIINFQNVKKNNCAGRCTLYGTTECPGHKRQADFGNKEKKFKIDSINYRKVASAGHYLVKTSKYKSLFLTLSLPPFKSKHKYTKSFIYEQFINQAFSRFVENLRKNYDCKGYVAVREYGTTGHRLHFHCVLSIPYTNFADLNSAWCSAISYLCYTSKNAITTRRETRILRKSWGSNKIYL